MWLREIADLGASSHHAVIRGPPTRELGTSQDEGLVRVLPGQASSVAVLAFDWHPDVVKVLVVEDDPALSASLTRSLEFEGYHVVSTADGESALAILAAGPTDCVVLDIGLPGISGLELTRRLRRDGVETPILMLTARQMTGDRVAGLDAGADDYVPKPFELEELLARVRALLRRAGGPAGENDDLVVGDLRLIREATRSGVRGGKSS